MPYSTSGPSTTSTARSWRKRPRISKAKEPAAASPAGGAIGRRRPRVSEPRQTVQSCHIGRPRACSTGPSGTRAGGKFKKSDVKPEQHPIDDQGLANRPRRAPVDRFCDRLVAYEGDGANERRPEN